MDKHKRSSLKATGSLATGLAVGLLPDRWKQPIINQVLLPAHAQTSLCAVDDIVGIWDFVEDGDLLSSIDFHADGTGTRGSASVVWSLDGDALSFQVGGSDRFDYRMTVTQPCTEMEGVNLNGDSPVAGTKRQ